MPTTMMRHKTSTSQRAGDRLGFPDDMRALIKRYAPRGRDPAMADENLYRYCDDQPTDATDPSGQSEQSDYYKDATSDIIGPTGFNSSDGIVTGKYWVDGSLTAGPPNLKAFFPEGQWDGWAGTLKNGNDHPVYNSRFVGAYVIAFDKDAGKNDPNTKGVRVWLSFYYVSSNVENGEEKEPRSTGWQFDNIWVGTETPYVDSPGNVVPPNVPAGYKGFDFRACFAVGIACMNKDKPSEFLNVPLKGVFAYCESDMFDNSDPAKPKTAALVNWNQRYVGAGNVQAWDGNVSAGDNTLTKNWGKVFQAKYPQVKLVNTFS